MLFKKLSILPLTLIAALVFTACAKTDYDGSLRALPQAVNPPLPQTQQAMPLVETATPVVTARNLPVISFVQNEISMNNRLEVRLELQLSEASKQPVTAIINLVDATARHYRDYTGFKGKASENTRTLIFPPGTTRLTLPVIGGRRTRFCDTYFYAKINPAHLQKARVLDNSAKILVPCDVAMPSEDAPPPVRNPLPPIEEPISQPCPVLVNARFEREKIKVGEHAKRVNIKIVLDAPSSLPVTFDFETQDNSALEKIDYVKVKVQLTIPAGQTSIDVPIELFKNKRCRTPDMHFWERHGKYMFRTVVTSITNANMAQPSAVIILKKDVSDDACSLPAPCADVDEVKPPPPPPVTY